MSEITTEFEELPRRIFLMHGCNRNEVRHLEKAGFKDATELAQKLVPKMRDHIRLCLARKADTGWQTFAIVDKERGIEGSADSEMCRGRGLKGIKILKKGNREKDSGDWSSFRIVNPLVCGGGIKGKLFKDPHSEETLKDMIVQNIAAAAAMADKFGVAGPYHDHDEEVNGNSIDGAKYLVALREASEAIIREVIRDIVRSTRPLLEHLWGTAGDEIFSYKAVDDAVKAEGLMHTQQGIAAGLGLDVPGTCRNLDAACKAKTTLEGIGEIAVVDMASAYTAVETLARIAEMRDVRMEDMRIAIQGTGAIGRAALGLLSEHKVQVMSISNSNGCIRSGKPLPILKLLETIELQPPRSWNKKAIEKLIAEGALSPDQVSWREGMAYDDSLAAGIEGVHLDAIMLCAGAHEVTERNQAAVLKVLERSPVKAVISASNGGINRRVEEELAKKGVLAPPDHTVNMGVARVFGQQLSKDPIPIEAGAILGDLKANIRGITTIAVNHQDLHKTPAR